MSLPRSLVLLVAVVCTPHLCAAQWPCPDPKAILPCVCNATEEYDIIMDCSNVASTANLSDVFQTHFAFSDFRQLVINPAVPSDSLLVLPDGVFGDVSFEEIDITNTLIHTVEEQALVNSHGTLSWLNLGRNEISSFPFETLDLFTVLRVFDISYNSVSGPSPDIESDYLLSLDMSGNTGLTFAETTFAGAPYLEELRLSDIGLGTTTPANMFHTLKYLETLYLDNNAISGTLIQNFINNEVTPFTTVYLNGNSIDSIHPLSVTGMNAEGTISFRNNLIQYLPQDEWGGLVSQLSNENAIDMRDNPVVCGCDVVWLVFDPTLMGIFHNETTCASGNYMADLPRDWFLEFCPGADAFAAASRRSGRHINRHSNTP